MNNENDFEFNYCAPTIEERREIESIRKNYLSPTPKTTKIEYLRKLDSKVKNIPIIISLILGIIGTLIFGLGLTMILEWDLLAFGIIVTTIGIIPVILAYPIFKTTSKNLKNKFSKEIIKISEELLNNEQK